MLTTRNFEDSDKGSLKSFYPHGEIPNFSNKLFVSKRVILKGEEIVGFAGIKIVTESHMFFKDCLTKRDKVMALKVMVDELKQELVKYGLDSCISFTDIPENLMAHFGYVPCPEPTKVKLFL